MPVLVYLILFNRKTLKTEKEYKTKKIHDNPKTKKIVLKGLLNCIRQKIMFVKFLTVLK